MPPPLNPRRAPRAASRRSLLLGAACAGGLTACGLAPAASGARVAVPPEPTTAALIRGWQSGEETRFLAAFAPGRSAQALGVRLWDTWRSLPEVGLAAAPGDVVEVTWRAGSESRPAAHRLRAVLRSGLVGDLVADGPLPLWLRAPIRVTGRGGAVLVTPRDADPALRAGWLAAAASASDRLTRARLGAAAAPWDGRLVVERPAGLIDFAAMVTLPGQALGGTAAVTRMDARDSGPRIVVNPQATADLSATAASDLLAHEGVHVATRSPWLTAPLWAVEGLAESVGASPGGEQALRNRELARSAVRRAGVPTQLPVDEAFGRSGVAVEEAYALAQVAVEACVDRFGRATFLGWVADWDAPGRADDADLTDAFVAAARTLG